MSGKNPLTIPIDGSSIPDGTHLFKSHPSNIHNSFKPPRQYCHTIEEYTPYNTPKLVVFCACKIPYSPTCNIYHYIEELNASTESDPDYEVESDSDGNSDS